MRKDFESAFSRSSHVNLRRLDRRIVLQEQNASSKFSSPLSCNFLAQTRLFCCIICTIYRATLFKIIYHDYSLTIKKKTWAITFPAEETLLTSWEVVSQSASIACFAFSTLGQSDEPVSSWVTIQSIKSPGSSSYRDRRHLEILSRDRFWSSVNILGTHLAETLDIPKISVRIVCTAPKLMPTSLAVIRF